jgi:hypothetical protein
MTPELIADGLLALLLAAALAAIVRLEVRLRTIRTGQAEMARTAQELNAAAHRAEAAIRGLRATAEGAGSDLDARISRARALADELSLLSDRSAQRTPSADVTRNVRLDEDRPALRALVGAR